VCVLPSDFVFAFAFPCALPPSSALCLLWPCLFLSWLSRPLVCLPRLSHPFLVLDISPFSYLSISASSCIFAPPLSPYLLSPSSFYPSSLSLLFPPLPSLSHPSIVGNGAKLTNRIILEHTQRSVCTRTDQRLVVARQSHGDDADGDGTGFCCC
jgi:hypothetical protein